MFLDIIDRRKNPKDKSLVNRQRFLKRQSKEIRAAIREKIRDGSVTDIASGQPTRVKISTRGTEEPVFRHAGGGIIERVLPGNKEYIPGDKAPKPQEEAGRGKSGSPDGEGEDEFVFEISQEEFLEYFFEDLALPDMIKRSLTGETTWKMRRAGFSTDGPPNTLDPLRTMRHAHARRLAFRIPRMHKKRALEQERDRLRAQIVQGSADEAAIRARLEAIEAELAALDRKIKAIPFLDDIDIRYRRHERIEVPITQAVMFCILDVSGSMGPWEKEMAKRFFMLLYLFLSRNYEKVDIVFIRHHHTAKEVQEEEFFQSRESGGTVVSSALQLMAEIIEQRYPPAQWNIYGCQASDGDDYTDDLPVVYEVIKERILPLVQYFAYVEVDARDQSELWSVYREVQSDHGNFAMTRITSASDIYPVFRKLFEHRKEGVPHG
jgi:uncharacterized sporulation protein YeaH/YhbH (DUF444 family)